jgi:hypothetical protein
VSPEERLERVRAAVDNLLDSASGTYVPAAGEERLLVPRSAVDAVVDALSEPTPADETPAA